MRRWTSDEWLLLLLGGMCVLGLVACGFLFLEYTPMPWSAIGAGPTFGAAIGLAVGITYSLTGSD